MIWRSAF